MWRGHHMNQSSRKTHVSSVPFHIMTGMRDEQVRPNESFRHTFSHSPFHFHKKKKKTALPCFVVIYYCSICSVKNKNAQLTLK